MLDNFPVATVTFLVSIVLIVIGYISNDLTLDQAFQSLLYAGGGSGAIGFVRNQSGRGVRR